MSLLVTGGSGYIGSHTVVELLQDQQQVVILDNLSNSSLESLNRIRQITNKEAIFIEGDIRDQKLIEQIIHDHNIDSVVHFAGLKAVGESVQKPLLYYDNNVNGTISLCRAMQNTGVFSLVFSSSATVYGEPEKMPIDESCPTGLPTNPYGRSKLIIEQILQDLTLTDSRWSIALLRYFNPIGAHESGLIGEDPNGIPNNLLPYISQVAVGRLKQVSVFGNDYPTIDGTGVRDYIHVVDLAKGHLAALNYIKTNTGIHTWNLGTGTGYSVLEIINAFAKACNKDIPYEFAPRRPGDIASCWSNPNKAKKELGWQAKLGLTDMVASAWQWQSKNPDGYGKK